MARCSWLALLAPLTQWATPMAASISCAKVKQNYKDNGCCGQPDKEVDTMKFGCPYDFNKPSCADAEPQSPRDLTTDGGTVAVGDLKPKAATLNPDQAAFLPLVNVHFHLGAEHKANDFKDATDADAWDNTNGNANRRLDDDFLRERRLAGDVRPGFMCDTSDLSAEQKSGSYTWQYCKNVEVGKSYEVHYVHSSAGQLTPEQMTSLIEQGIKVQDYMSDGLGGAANGRGQRNPMVVVEGQVYQIVKGAGGDSDDLLHGWSTTDHSDAVMYAGSTTGPSHGNEVCSPYAISWHVDRKCKRVSPEAFDLMCKNMKDKYGLSADLYPHGSRMIVDQKYVVKGEYVYQYGID